MYPVSQDYIEAIKKPFRVRRLTGYVGSVPFTQENIIAQSFRVYNVCSDGNEVKIGTVGMGVFECIFHGLTVDQWYGKQITVSEGLQIAVNTWEDVPLGVYTIVQAERRESGVYVQAYDNMNLLNKDFVLSNTSGTPYDFLALIADKCNITLAQTEQQIRALPNGTQGLVLYAENDIETYRDLLHYIGQVLCCFATFDRLGNLEMRQYGSTSVDDIGLTDRFRSCSFSDYVTRYTGISVVKIDKEETYYKGFPVDDALTYNLGSNPLLQMASLDGPLMNILQGLQVIEYTPFTVDRSGCPAYDLGDKVTFPDGLGAGCVGAIMSYEYTFHGTYRIEGYGSNPALMNVRSKTDKDIAGLMSKEAVSGRLQFYAFTNASNIELREDYKEIIYIRFGSLKATMVTFQAEIALNAELEVIDDVYDDIIGNIKYVFNLNEVSYHPAETWLDGDHILHLLYFFPISEATVNRLSVLMNCENGVITIDRGNIQAGISGQGLAASDTWDGYIEIEDTIGEVTTEGMETAEVTDDADLDLVDVILIEASDNIAEEDITTEPGEVAEFDDAAYLNKRRAKDYTWNDLKEYTWAEVLELFNW